MGLDHDPDRVTRLVSEIRDAVTVLRDLGELPQDTFLGDDHKVGNAKYKLIVAIEGCLDLANHVISRNELRMPEGYADTFAVLAENDVLEAAFADRLGEMARFRNRLVHIYWDVDDARVHRYLEHELGDLDRFLDAILDQLG